MNKHFSSFRYGQRSDDVVVSGSGLPVFAAVARLLNTGVAPTRITVVVKEDEGFIDGLTEKNVRNISLRLMPFNSQKCDSEPIFDNLVYFLLCIVDLRAAAEGCVVCGSEDVLGLRRG